jgi:hypothetical protein
MPRRSSSAMEEHHPPPRSLPAARKPRTRDPARFPDTLLGGGSVVAGEGNLAAIPAALLSQVSLLVNVAVAQPRASACVDHDLHGSGSVMGLHAGSRFAARFRIHRCAPFRRDMPQGRLASLSRCTNRATAGAPLCLDPKYWCQITWPCPLTRDAGPEREWRSIPACVAGSGVANLRLCSRVHPGKTPCDAHRNSWALPL